MAISNKQILNHTFFESFPEDYPYTSEFIIRSKDIFLRLCATIESSNPSSVEELYKLTHCSVEEFNRLNEELLGGDLDTIGAETIFIEFLFIAYSYGFDVKGEDIVSNRNW